MTHYDIKIDELKICYVTDIENLMKFEGAEARKFIDCFGYRFYRIINDRFRFFFDIMLDGEQVAQMKFWHYTDLNNKVIYVYFKVANAVLYDKNRFAEVLKLPTLLNLVFNNFTSIDLACDSTQNFPSLIKKMMRDKEVTTIINGKAIHDRKTLLQGVTFDYSTTLSRLVHPTITIRQKKAITNKCDGIIIQAYNKKAEIENKSNKRYILDYYGNPKHLYRLEVRLHYQELKDYFARQYIVPTTEVVLDGDLLTDMFLYHLGAVVRFTRCRRKILWQDLIGCNVRG